jgi:hypothetical protein
MHYKLLGFSQSGSVRRFSFQRVGINATPTPFTVLADIMLARKFKLALQELPSLCSRLLERGGEDQPAGTLSLTEADMSMCAHENEAAALKEAEKRAFRAYHGALARAASTGTDIP